MTLMLYLDLISTLRVPSLKCVVGMLNLHTHSQTKSYKHRQNKWVDRAQCSFYTNNFQMYLTHHDCIPICCTLPQQQ